MFQPLYLLACYNQKLQRNFKPNLIKRYINFLDELLSQLKHYQCNNLITPYFKKFTHENVF